eukprot:TRINITY_DN18581_c0_g1_i1.p1 TRINITY_DN18581_c0_g1~~TRINITY_DN18581_c0_g1_i1.p1  ORF type:complete len:1292 (+),score=248.31 TRINITY_DN18581_c0_g1_i1:295-4170(+)
MAAIHVCQFAAFALTRSHVQEVRQAVVQGLIPSGSSTGVLGDRADAVGGLARLAFHDAGTYDGSAACPDRGGPDGCLMFSDGANAGLAFVAEHLNPICETFAAPHAAALSRADCYQLAGTIALEEALPSGVNVDFKFEYGRSDSDSCQQEAGRLPSAEGASDHVLGIFHHRMGLTVGEVVALNGAHSVGRASSTVSGYPGATVASAAGWVTEPAVFDNGLYTEMVAGGWQLVQAGAGSQNYFINNDSSPLRLSLISDLGLLYDFGAGSQEADPSKNPTVCSLEPTRPQPCMKLAQNSTRQWVELFAADRDAFYREYVSGWVKLQGMGYSNLLPVCENDTSCVQPTPRAPCVSTPAPASCAASTLQGQYGALFSCHLQVPGLQNVELHWTLGTATTLGPARLDLAVRASGDGWVGLGFPQVAGRMTPSRAVIGWQGSAGAVIDSYRLETSGGTRSATASAAAGQEVAVSNTVIERSSGTTTLFISTSLCSGGAATGDGCVDVSSGNLNLIVAHHPTANELLAHPLGSQTGRGFSVSLTTGAATDLSDTARRDARRQHGRLMIAAWFYLGPFAVFCRRYAKPVFAIGMSARPTWRLFVLHVLPAVGAVSAAIAAFGIAWKHWWTFGSKGIAHSGHSEVAHLMFFLVILQPVIGVAGLIVTPTFDHPLRPAFNAVHGSIGWLMLILGPINCCLGYRNLKDLDTEDLSDHMIIGLTFFCACFAMAEFIKQRLTVQAAGQGASAERLVVTMDDVRKHCHVFDCWVVIDGSAHDVTEFLSFHPGGPSFLTDNAGQDATKNFNEVKHSANARALLQKYYVADVDSNRVTNSVNLAERVTSALVLLELDRAEELINDGDEQDLPEALSDSLRRLVKNLASYRQYLPQSLLVMDDSDSSSESDSGIKSPQRVLSDPTSFSVEDVLTPKTRDTSFMKKRALSTTSVGKYAPRADDKSRAILDEKMALQLKSKAVTLLATNLSGLLVAHPITRPGPLMDLLTGYLDTVASECLKQKGVVDQANGDRVVVSFNAAVRGTQHRSQAALLTVRLGSMFSGTSQTPSNRKPTIQPIRIALASGNALCGNIGGTTMRRFTILGSLYGWVSALDRLSSKWPCGNICDTSVQEAANGVFDTRLIAKASWQKHKLKTLLWSVRNEIQVGEEEWMYQLQQAGNSSLWAPYNQCVLHFLNGDMVEARRAVADADKRDLADEVRLALSALERTVNRHDLDKADPQDYSIGEILVTKDGSVQNEPPPHVADLFTHGLPSDVLQPPPKQHRSTIQTGASVPLAARIRSDLSTEQA